MRTLSLKPFAVFGAAALLTLAAGMAFATTPARAAGLTSVQVQAILSLLSSFGADQSVINNVSAALGGQATAPSSSCVDLSQNLTLGSSGSDVTNLQNYLIVKGDLAAGYNTGYYGFLTAQAVGKLQLNLGILSSANDSAYGITGPQTRSAIGCGSTNPPTQPPVIPPSSSASLTATPASGAAPLAVQFSGRTHALADGSYSLQFGDGQEDDSPVNNPTTSDCIIHDNCIVSASHTYRQPGTYMVKLIGNPDMSAVPVTVSTATVTVTGQSTSAAPSISSLSSNSGLPGTQITINGRGLDAQGTIVYFDSQNNTAVQNFVSVGPQRSR